MKKNENFVDETIEAAETAYKKNFEAQVKDFADSNRGSLLGDLASMVSSDIQGKKFEILRFPSAKPK